MIRRCLKCNKEYDDAECTTICPHPLLMPRDDLEHKKAAIDLLVKHKRVRFVHDVDAINPGWKDIVSVSWDGMITLSDMTGEYAPHLFVTEE